MSDAALAAALADDDALRGAAVRREESAKRAQRRENALCRRGSAQCARRATG